MPSALGSGRHVVQRGLGTDVAPSECGQVSACRMLRQIATFGRLVALRPLALVAVCGIGQWLLVQQFCSL